MTTRKASVHRLAVPTPFPVGPINVWLIEGHPLTLIDAGPRTPEAGEALDRLLGERGHRVEDVEQVVVTHGHIDHFGLARRIRDRSGAPIAVFEGDRRMVEDFVATHRRIFARYEALSLEAGFPADLMARTSQYFEVFFEVAQDTSVDRALAAGEEVQTGIGPLRVVPCPGHTAGSICLLEVDGGRLFSGDNILKNITSNAFFAGGSSAKVGLVHFLDSLGQIGSLPITQVLPGHGPVIPDLSAHIRKIMVHHDRRSAAVRAIVARGPARGWDVATTLFGELPISTIWLGLAESLGHLELLEHKGEIRAHLRDGFKYYTLDPRAPSMGDVASRPKRAGRARASGEE